MMRPVNPNAHWRDSARRARFFMVDAQAVFPIFLFLVHIRIWTLILAILATIFFATISRFGFSTIVFLRLARSFLAGPIKVAYPWWMWPNKKQ
jgi:intracellular multiplication protein IcmT